MVQRLTVIAVPVVVTGDSTYRRRHLSTGTALTDNGLRPSFSVESAAEHHGLR